MNDNWKIKDDLLSFPTRMPRYLRWILETSSHIPAEQLSAVFTDTDKTYRWNRSKISKNESVARLKLICSRSRGVGPKHTQQASENNKQKKRRLAPLQNVPLMTDWLNFGCFYSRQPSLGRGPLCKWMKDYLLYKCDDQPSPHAEQSQQWTDWLTADAPLIHLRENCWAYAFCPRHYKGVQLERFQKLFIDGGRPRAGTSDSENDVDFSY